MLPGGGGIDVFGDSHFYFDVAREWNKAGFDVLVIHYQAAAPLVKGAAQANPAAMEAAVVADALETAREKHWLDLQCPGMVMGFSLGGAGTLKLAAEPPKNLVGAIGFYPAVVGQSADYRAAVPVLALQGDLGSGDPAGDPRRLRRQVEGSGEIHRGALSRSASRFRHSLTGQAADLPRRDVPVPGRGHQGLGP